MSEPRAKRDRLKRLVGLEGRRVRVNWLVRRWSRVRNANLRAVALEMVSSGLFSPNTGITDITISLGGGYTGGRGLMAEARSKMLRNPNYKPNNGASGLKAAAG